LRFLAVGHLTAALLQFDTDRGSEGAISGVRGCVAELLLRVDVPRLGALVALDIGTVEVELSAARGGLVRRVLSGRCRWSRGRRSGRSYCRNLLGGWRGSDLFGRRHDQVRRRRRGGHGKRMDPTGSRSRDRRRRRVGARRYGRRWRARRCGGGEGLRPHLGGGRFFARSRARRGAQKPGRQRHRAAESAGDANCRVN
jgi:hypothetical protein